MPSKLWPRLFVGIFLTIVFVLSTNLPGAAQNQTVGLVVFDTASYPGYTLFKPGTQGETAYLIDHYGRYVHSWNTGVRPGGGIYLLEDGDLLFGERTSNPGSHIIKLDWESNIVWEWLDADSGYTHHHDVEPMPNGNILVLGREFKTKSEAAQAGRDTSTLSGTALWPEIVLEVEPSGVSGGTVVWEWRVWDHLIQDFDPTKDNYGVVEDHPELMDVNYAGSLADWLHANSVAYDEEVDQVIISMRSISEIWVIDHSTSTVEAAGHTGGSHGMGGDIIYRWGNPEVYRAGDSADQRLFSQHDAEWIKPGLPGEGHILVFNNGNDRNYSSVDEIMSPANSNGLYPQPPPGTPHGPTDPYWSYVDNPPDSMYSWFISGSQRLPNGNTLVCNGAHGDFREVTPDGEIVWRYINAANDFGPINQGDDPTGNISFRCTRIHADYPGLAGQDLTSGAPIEVNPVTISGTAHSPVNPHATDPYLVITAAITAPAGISFAEVYVDTGFGEFVMTFYDDGMHMDSSAADGFFGAVISQPLSPGPMTYYIHVTDGLSQEVNDPPNPPATLYHVFIDARCGNIDGIIGPGGPVDVADLNYLVDFLFRSGPPPADMNAANVDGIVGVAGPIDVADLSYLVDYLFRSGPAPNCP